MKAKIPLFLIIILIVFFGCTESDFPELPIIPAGLQNVDVINTEFDEHIDDVAVFLNYEISVQISSNRNSLGQDLDIHNYFLSFNNNIYSNNLAYFLNTDGFNYIDSALVSINTDFNENNVYINYSSNHNSDILFYSSNQNGSEDIYYSIGDYQENTWEGPILFNKINTEDNENGLIVFYQEIIFCSDFEGNYDIYSADISNNISFIDWLSNEETAVKRSFEVINSTFDDKCPNINGNYLFFSSNRDGGYGGYDLYYSHYSLNGWSEPVNCGDQINSEFDELNPKAVFCSNYKNDLLLFSSNRLGGKGGYDIYSIAIASLIN